MAIQGAAKTDVGKVRSGNEDAYGLFPDVSLYVVADGMGGHAGGEVASSLAVETMHCSLQETLQEDLTPILDTDGECSIDARRLMIAIEQANSKVFALPQEHPDLAGLGTTVAALLFSDQENLVSIGHVGDSRAYRIRDGTMSQLTEDHSLVQQLIQDGKIDAQEAASSPHRHVLTQAVGIRPIIHPSLRLERPQRGDIFLLCSDGVHGTLSLEEIVQIVDRERANLQKACDQLIDLVNNRGGRDNSTVMVLQYEEN